MTAPIERLRFKRTAPAQPTPNDLVDVLWDESSGSFVSQTEDGSRSPLGGGAEVTNAAVAAAIAENSAAVRAAAGMVDDNGTLPESLLGSYSRNLLKSPDGSLWSVGVDNTGALTSELFVGPELASYQADTGIDLEAAHELQVFYNALDAAGVLGNVVDGAILKSRYARIQNGQIRSLRGTAPLVLSSTAPVLGDCALIFNGSSAGKATLQSHPLARSFFCLSALKQNFQSPYTNIGHPWVVKNQFATNTFAGEYIRFADTTTPAVGSMYGSGATARTVDPDGYSRSFPPKSFFSSYTYNGTLPNYTANGFTFKNYGGTKRLGSTSQNGASHTPYWITLGGGYYGGTASSPSEMSHCAIANWLLFDKVLSDAEIAAVYEAFFLLHPRWKYVPGGDSLQQFQSPYFLTLPEVYGSNVKVQNIAAGGLDMPTIVAGLGTTYYSASHLAADGPVVADYINIDTPTASYTSTDYIDDLRAVWTHIKTVNPAAKIIAQTITSSEGIETEGTLAELAVVNAQIRADVGTYTDVLVDSWQIAEDMKRPEYTYQHDDTTVIVDGIHPSAALATAISQAKLAAIESLGINIR